MNPAQIKQFQVICQEGTVGRAAKKLYIARTSLSTSIKKLEAELGVELLHRGKEGVSPTEAGRVLYEYSLASDRLLTDYLGRIQAIKDRESKTIRFGCAGGILEAATLASIYDYEQKMPGTAVDIVGNDCANFWKAIEDGGIDCALTTRPPAMFRIAKRHIAHIQHYLIVSNDTPLASLPWIDFCRDLDGTTLFEIESRFTPYLRELEALGIRYKTVGEDFSFIGQLVTHKKGSVMVPLGLVHRYAVEGTRAIPVRNIPASIDLDSYIAYGCEARPEVRAFVDYVATCLHDTVASEAPIDHQQTGIHQVSQDV